MTSSFKDIIAWQKAHQFVLLVYKATACFPDCEKFSLVSQFQRAAVSIPANIAEGYRKDGVGDKKYLLVIVEFRIRNLKMFVKILFMLMYVQ